MEQNKIRIAMVCHFSNADVRSHLPLDESRKLYAFVRKVLGMPTKGKNYGDIASWDTSTIKFFREQNDIELYVISAHSGLKKRVVSYEDQGVHYSFVRCERATMLKRVIPNDALWRKLNPMVKDVHRLIGQIKPDIVLLMGTENAYYSSTVLGLNKYPVYTLCQTVYNNPERMVYSKVDSKNASTEMEIIKEHRYFGVYCKKHYDLLKGIAPDRFIFKFGFPSSGKMLDPSACEKKYDFVNFALSMSAKKGYPDAIKATALVKKKYPEVKLNLVGGVSAEQKAELQKLADDLGVHDNVIFTPFFEKKSDLFLHIQQSRFALLPCKMDNVSGTMTQSMHLELPLIVYKTTGTPAFNREKECILIAEKGNVEELAQCMLDFMEHPEKAEMLAKNAREYQEKLVEQKKQNGERLMANIRAIIENYRNGTPIPQEQLFDPQRDE
ncbi:MAG: glycosyltransferase family 4 protein [Bacteroidales bacterium]|nr:glycosyltransferase family 4 protein [Bacteroidales bacterium]